MKPRGVHARKAIASGGGEVERVVGVQPLSVGVLR